MDEVVEKVKLSTINTDKDVLEWMFADLTFQTLPDIRIDDWGLLAMPLTSKPFFQATESYESHRARALTWRN